MLRAFSFEGRFLACSISGVATTHPPPEADDTPGGDEEREAEPEPGGHPFAGEKQHDSNYRQDDDRLAPSRV